MEKKTIIRTIYHQENVWFDAVDVYNILQSMDVPKKDLDKIMVIIDEVKEKYEQRNKS